MPRRLRITHFSSWAETLRGAEAFLDALPQVDLRGRVARAGDPELLRMARLDCDWHGENTRVFAALSHPDLEFLPARVCGAAGLLELARAPAEPGVESWLVFDGQGPQKLAGVLGRLAPLLRRAGVRFAWYAFDEASRTTTAFSEIAPYLDVLIHDEAPLDPEGEAALPRHCVKRHRSWVANLIPFSIPFAEAPEPRILFLGSRLGLTDHRKRQISFLEKTFKDRFVAIADHSVAVGERALLTRFKVSVCPEGRKFATPGMNATHTDRPFWSGCMGLVPVSENARTGGRLEALAEGGLVLRYAHGDLNALKSACEQALETPLAERRRIYDHFNRHETVGTVLADALGACPPPPATAGMPQSVGA
jgi:hypothetical protein